MFQKQLPRTFIIALAWLMILAAAGAINADDFTSDITNENIRSLTVTVKRVDKLEKRLDRLASHVERLSDLLTDVTNRIDTIKTNLETQAAAPQGESKITSTRPISQTLTVAVTQNPDPNVTHLFEALEHQTDRLPEVSTQLSNARERYREYRQLKFLDPKMVSKARQEMIGFEYEQREIKSLIRRISLEIETARTNRVVTGLTEDGAVVQIQATGGLSDLASTLSEGSTYRISGTTFENNGLIHLVMTSAEPTDLNLPVADAGSE